MDEASLIFSLMYVRCPRCHRCACVKPRMDAHAGLFDPRRLSCLYCGHTKDWHGRQVGGSASVPTDWYFHLPLWLQVSCCGKLLWAYNHDHLDFLEDYVQATLREGLPEQATAAFKNKTAAGHCQLYCFLLLGGTATKQISTLFRSKSLELIGSLIYPS